MSNAPDAMIIIVVPTIAKGARVAKRPREIILSVQQILAGQVLAGLKAKRWVAAENAEAHADWAAVVELLDAKVAEA